MLAIRELPAMLNDQYSYAAVCLLFRELYSDDPYFSANDTDNVERYLEDNHPASTHTALVNGANILGIAVFNTHVTDRTNAVDPEKPETHIHSLAIAAHEQGRGYGRKMLGDIACRSVKAQDNLITVCSTAASEDFYKKAGFTPLGNGTFSIIPRLLLDKCE